MPLGDATWIEWRSKAAGKPRDRKYAVDDEQPRVGSGPPCVFHHESTILCPGCAIPYRRPTPTVPAALPASSCVPFYPGVQSARAML